MELSNTKRLFRELEQAGWMSSAVGAYMQDFLSGMKTFSDIECSEVDRIGAELKSTSMDSVEEIGDEWLFGEAKEKIVELVATAAFLSAMDRRFKPQDITRLAMLYRALFESLQFSRA